MADRPTLPSSDSYNSSWLPSYLPPDKVSAQLFCAGKGMRRSLMQIDHQQRSGIDKRNLGAIRRPGRPGRIGQLILAQFPRLGQGTRLLPSGPGYPEDTLAILAGLVFWIAGKGEILPIGRPRHVMMGPKVGGAQDIQSGTVPG